ncbi:DNA-binding transcriptional regulator, MarR family [Acetoanaerobium noterae]|jgi:DNA-binding MarR family transcriptional regulator|uniref:Transcriptional regulator, MarR family n=2 Tax=Acetoanaerobium TaxID=186831 RepID=E3PXD5_ACESD|nr:MULTISPECIES: MarR family transcriptional regulator [Acetoanaerobium]MBP8763073.1 MarR family transcriptional regulator [Acetoanaerobium sp.]MBP9499843.1 MarR family transcriptional regulator [Acetoanaerobium sp.]MBP9562751.1 MarR family transcriptional regulator [Acetoanaerobium sp.]CBH21100.1 Transcriptional regulator, MarR family [Acetoanaerobium sticklandii]SKB56096.1 DNA-binding transcriptional regulator, MarR family [Acetoanaerobium noterae]
MKPEDKLKLDNQLCFAVYVASKEIIKQYKPFLDPLGLTYTQYITLLALWEKSDISVKELGQRLFLDSGTLTPLLKKLEAMNLIERVRSSDDERLIIVSLTKKGLDLKKEVIDIPDKIICSTNLNIENAVSLKKHLDILLDGMCK